MKARDLLHETGLALASNKSRSALTILGIVIGITAVVTMVSLITGFEVWLEDSMGLGSARMITVTASDSSLDTDDVAFLERAVDEVEQAIPVARTSVTVASQTESDSSSSTSSSDVTVQVTGVDASYFSLGSITMSSGSAYSSQTDSDDKSETDLSVVLSEDAVESIYGDADTNVVGQSIDLGDATFTIVGVSESSSMGFSMATAYVPYETACSVLIGDETVDMIVAEAATDSDVTYVASKIEGALAARHVVEFDEDGDQDVYTASTTESSLSSLETFTVAFDALAILVAGIALLVGGIGIMNMMLTNVTERIREIGLRKALGARPRDIQLQFLTESVALCLIGGVIGAILGYAGAWGLASLATQFYSTLEGLTPVVSLQLVGIVFLICAGIGVVFGFYPARRASKLSPADTLRYQ